MLRSLTFLLACLMLACQIHAPLASAQSSEPQTGLIAGEQFEGWIRYVRPEGIRATRMRLAKGDSLRIIFPAAFRPVAGDPEAYFVYGWTHGDAAAEYLVTLDDRDRRTIILSVAHTVAKAIPMTPGRQTVHVLAPLRNPPPGRYVIRTIVTHGAKTLRGHDVITIVPRTMPTISLVRSRVRSQRANYQSVAAGRALPIPLDFLITDVDGTHPANISLQQIDTQPGSVSLMRAGLLIGNISASGGVVLVAEQSPHAGIVRVAARAPSAPGRGFVVAHLAGGTRAQYTFTVRAR